MQRPSSVAFVLILLLGGPLATPTAGVALLPGDAGGRGAPVETVALPGDRLDAPGGISLPEGTDVGWITVPRLGLERFPIRMGTDYEVLAGAVGLYPGSEAPGTPGNFATAGHRVTDVADMGHGPYYDLDLLVEGDTATVEYGGTTYRYEFLRSAVVAPTAVWVLDDDRGDLTMTACHPKGSLAQRIVAWWSLSPPDPTAQRAASLSRTRP